MHVKSTKSGNLIVGNDSETYLISGLRPCEGYPGKAHHAFKFNKLTECKGQDKDGNWIYGDPYMLWQIANGLCPIVSPSKLSEIMKALDAYALSKTSNTKI